MQADNFSLAKYLRRIDFDGQCAADIESVRALMSQQLKNIPFENLDVRAGKPVSLKPGAVADKILRQRRGGYCFELNAIFAMAMTALAIPHRYVAARPMLYTEKRPKTHMALVLELDGKQWLCDLGFGRYGIRAPVRLDDLDREIVQGYDRFRLSRADDENYRLAAWNENDWIDQFEFDLSPQAWVDFEPANYYTSTHPESLFVNNLIVLRFTDDGRKILCNDRLKIIDRNQVTERHLLENELASILRDEFDLIM